MSKLDRDETPATGFSFALDMGVDGRFQVDVFRAHEPVLDRWHEEVLVNLEGLRTSDEKLDSVTIALEVADARVLAGTLIHAVAFIEKSRADRAKRKREGK